jgi:Leucine-rich repeat (LRR) protein
MTIQGLPSFSVLQSYLKNRVLLERLKRIRNYSSEFKFIDKAIQQIPEGTFNPEIALTLFNKMIVSYERVIKPFPIISHLQELQDLERRLENYSLQALWDSLWRDPSLSVADKPKLETMEEIKEWFKNAQNRPLLDRVTTLTLKDRNIIQLPREIFQLRNLRVLDLHGNLLETLPESIKIWKKLRRLNLSRNELTYLPHNGIKHLKKLQYLHVRGNWLNALPKSIARLKKLKKLNIKENYLSKLPKGIGECIALENLDVSSNMLSELPVEIQNLTNLKKFSCADNGLSALPRGIENWKKIQKVDLTYNLFASNTEGFLTKLWSTNTRISVTEEFNCI